MRHFIVEDFITPMYCPSCGHECNQEIKYSNNIDYNLMISCDNCEMHTIGTYYFRDTTEFIHKRYVAHKSYTASNFIEMNEEKMRVKGQEED